MGVEGRFPLPSPPSAVSCEELAMKFFQWLAETIALEGVVLTAALLLILCILHYSGVDAT